MHFEVRQNQTPARKYATHLRCDRQEKKLVWESSPGQDALVVQTPFNAPAIESIGFICKQMNGMELPTDHFVEVNGIPGVWVRYVTSVSYTRGGGCPICTKACTYTIFCCEYQGNECIVYTQNVAGTGNLPYRNVQLDLPVQVRKVTQTKGFSLSAKEVETGYYQIILPREYANTLTDGDVYYTLPEVNGMEIPLTRRMFELGSVYVQCHEPPNIASHNKGLRVVQ